MATLLGAASLALILPLTAWGYTKKMTQMHGIRRNLTLPVAKGSCYSSEERGGRKKKKDDSERSRGGSQKKKSKEEVAKEAMEAAQHLPPHMRKFQITTS